MSHRVPPAPLLSVLVLLALACGSGCGSAPAPELPNLMLVSVDTLRADRLACYGGAPEVAPAICGLADDGTRFVWAFSAAPSTAPSVASLLTSQYPRDHGVSQFARTTLADEAVTLAEVLSAAGYATGAFVANPVIARGRQLGQGFDIYDDRMRRHEGNRAMMEREASELTDAALKWAQVAPAPWFLWVHYQDPHGPYSPPDAPAAWDPAGAERLPLLEDHSGLRGIPAYQALRGVWSLPAYERRYAEEIRYLDTHLARLLAGVDALPRRPAVALTADHGEAFGEDDFFLAHGHSVGIEQIRVPLLWRPAEPGVARVDSTPVSTLDIAPTFLAAAGLPAPAAFDGHALPVTAGSPARSDPLFAEHRKRAAVVAGRLYYARDRRPLPEPVADRITGGALPGLPPRTARLGADGAPASYDPDAADAIAAAEPLLADFIGAEPAPGAPGPTHPGPTQLGEPAAGRLDSETREALRALGYLE